MSLAIPAALMLMALSAAPTEASGGGPPCAEGERRVEWQEDAPGRVHEVCVSPGWATTFFFDARVERLELEGPERFQVLKGEEGFSLRLKEKLPEGTRLALTVHLQGEAVWSLSFVLRVQAARGERQVVASRAPRTLDSYREGEKQARAELRQCQQQKERLQADCEGPGGLLGLLVKKLMNKHGVRGQLLKRSLQGDALSLEEGRSYRSLARVAVALWWRNPGAVARKVTRVVLVGPQGEEVRPLNVWLPEPLPPGESDIVAVEWEATAVQASGEYTLQLWGEGGEGEAEWRMEVRGVRFPAQE
jgi:uncharacterized protein (TIGR02268 family)